MKSKKLFALLPLLALMGCSVELPEGSGISTASAYSGDLTPVGIVARDMHSSNCVVDADITTYLNGSSGLANTAHEKLEFCGNKLRLTVEAMSESSSTPSVGYIVLENKELTAIAYIDGAYYYSPTTMHYDGDVLTPDFLFNYSGNYIFKERVYNVFSNMDPNSVTFGEDGRYHVPDFLLHADYSSLGITVEGYEETGVPVTYKDIYFTVENDKLATLEYSVATFNLKYKSAGVYVFEESEELYGSAKLSLSNYGNVAFDLPSEILEYPTNA